jgi:hypothetical protein
MIRRLVPVVLLLLSSNLPAQNSSALINEALDKQVALDLNGT